MLDKNLCSLAVPIQLELERARIILTRALGFGLESGTVLEILDFGAQIYKANFITILYLCNPISIRPCQA